MKTHSSVSSKTRAKILTGITVAAAGVAAYMVGSLSNDLVRDTSLPSSSITRADERRSCLMACEHNGGFPCGASIDPASEASCVARVRSCQLGCPAADSYTVVLQANGLRELLPNGQVGMNYHRTLVALPVETYDGGIWEITKGALPPGMGLDPLSGTLSGVPSRADSYKFYLTRSVMPEKATEPIRATARVELTIDPAVVVSTAPAGPAVDASLPAIGITTPIERIILAQGQEIDIQLSVYGIPAADQEWTVAYGRLPDGIRLLPNGRLYGKSVEPIGRYPFGITVTSQKYAANGIRAYADGKIELVSATPSTPPVAPKTESGQGPGTNADTSAAKILPTSLPVGAVGEAYSVMLSVENTAAYTWTVTGLPNGLSFMQEKRVISGIPTEDGVYTVKVAASPLTGGSSVKTYTLTINRPALPTDADKISAVAANESIAAPAMAESVIDPNVPEAIAGTPYTAQLRTIPSIPNLHWSIGPLKASTGWKMTATGMLTHASPQVGIVTISVFARSADGTSTLQKEVIVNVHPASAADVASSGSGSTSASTGSTSSAKAPSEADASSQVAPTAIRFTSAAAYPDGTVGVAYSSRPFEVVGGQAPYVYTRISGTLPLGLSLATNGIIEGTPTVANTYTFTMRVTDAAGKSIQADRSIRIASQTSSPGSSASSGGSSGQAVSGGGGGGGGAIGGLTVLPNSESAATQARLAIFNRLGIRVHDLVKLQDDGDPNTQHDTTVYYMGSDGRRHFFPNAKVYFTWFPDFGGVRIVSPSSLAEIPLGANITYRPGVRMVKFESENKVYVVEGGRRLRWIQSESDASSIYGMNWNRNIDDIPVIFYTDYVFGSTLGSGPSSFSPAITMATVTWPSQVLP